MCCEITTELNKLLRWTIVFHQLGQAQAEGRQLSTIKSAKQRVDGAQAEGRQLSTIKSARQRVDNCLPSNQSSRRVSNCLPPNRSGKGKTIVYHQIGQAEGRQLVKVCFFCKVETSLLRSTKQRIQQTMRESKGW